MEFMSVVIRETWGAVEAETKSSETSICPGLFQTHFLACSKSRETGRGVRLPISDLGGLYRLPS